MGIPMFATTIITISFIKIKKSRGPRFNTCGTRNGHWNSRDSAVFQQTYCPLPSPMIGFKEFYRMISVKPIFLIS